MIVIAFQAAAALIALTAAIMAWRLEKRLARVKTGQDSMQQAAAALTQAVARAEASVRALRAEGAETAQELETLIARGRSVSDELRLLQEGSFRREPAREAAREPARRLPESLRPAGADLMEKLRRVR